MAFKVYFILLVSSVLAAAYKGFQESTISGDSSLWRYFHWSHVNETALQLSWPGAKLVELKVTAIVVTASQTSRPRYIRHYRANVEEGQLIIAGLMRQTEYALTTHVHQSGGQGVVHTIHVTTGQNGYEYYLYQ
ncbi:hypothetical protein TcWFU_010423 [Taenia crassiceps]|uniref:Salivary secreted peptide n=1 Tax=Taenia crassiceps TaxID=6207 RepID=A0ABR4Q470_9CEST